MQSNSKACQRPVGFLTFVDDVLFLSKITLDLLELYICLRQQLVLITFFFLMQKLINSLTVTDVDNNNYSHLIMIFV